MGGAHGRWGMEGRPSVRMRFEHRASEALGLSGPRGRSGFRAFRGPSGFRAFRGPSEAFAVCVADSLEHSGCAECDDLGAISDG